MGRGLFTALIAIKRPLMVVSGVRVRKKRAACLWTTRPIRRHCLPGMKPPPSPLCRASAPVEPAVYPAGCRRSCWQQTTVGGPFPISFMLLSRWPDVTALAAGRGPLDDVAQFLVRTRYYARARQNLQRLCQSLAGEHGWRFPDHRSMFGGRLRGSCAYLTLPFF